MNPSTVSAELAFRLIVPQQTIVPLVASLYYSSEDPYAIRVAFHVGLDEPVEWIFARDLLASGIKGRDGLGDVRVWPAPATSHASAASASAPASASAAGEGGAGDDAAEQVLHIELSSPFGEAHFEAPIRDVSDFLRRTYRIVPVGEETGFVDVEGELTNLLRQA